MIRWTVLLIALVACEKHDVEVEAPTLAPAERAEIQRIADATFREVRVQLPMLPPRITLIVKHGKDVIPETGESGSNGFPDNVGWTIDPDRDVLVTIRTQLRASLAHELHHLARAGAQKTVTLRDRVVMEGLATAFERDFAHVNPPWGEPPPEAWIAEILALPPDAPVHDWVIKHPDGRRWIGMRVGTALVDRTHRSAASLVLVPTSEIVLTK